ncbi:hypothetical protein ILFOPFJJ_00873 [Ensifer psoraleae]|nr:hypothetical protein [Sinorhizobium psoraleae]
MLFVSGSVMCPAGKYSRCHNLKHAWNASSEEVQVRQSHWTALEGLM